MSRHLRPLSLLFSLSLASLAAHAAPTYEVSLVGSLGGPSINPNGINNNGQVVGIALTPDNRANAYISSNGTAASLQPAGNANIVDSSAAAVNDAGVVAGEVSYQGGPTHAVSFANGQVQDLGTLGGRDSFAYGINNAGQVVGSAYLAGDNATHAFLSAGNGLQDLGTLGGSYSEARDVNNFGLVTGYAYITGDTGYDAFVYSGGSMHSLGTLGGNYSEGYAINDAGQVAGYSYLAGDVVSHAVLFANGSVVDLGGLGGSDSYATSINSDGLAVGAANDAQGNYHAFLYSGGTLQDLDSLIDPGLGWALNFAGGINDKGQIAAHGCQANGQCADLLLTLADSGNGNPSPVPEPEAFSAGLAGLALLRALRRRQSR